MFYVYVHYKKDSGEPFYVGKGKGRRYLVTYKRSKWWNAIVAKHGLYSEILFEFKTEKEAFNREKSLIAVISKSYKLCNMTEGGEGTSGRKLPQYHIDRLRSIHTGKPTPHTTGSNNVRWAGTILGKNIKEKTVVTLNGYNDIVNAGFNPTHVYSCCNGKRKTHKGYSFERITNGDPTL